MKKIFTATLLSLAILASAAPAFAANNVSQAAVNCGGKMVAQCAQTMERGVSGCLQGTGCNDMPCGQ